MPELQVFSLVIAANQHIEQHFRDNFISIPDCAPLQFYEMAPQSPEHFMNLFLNFFLCESRSPERGQPNWHWKLFISSQGNNSLQCLYSQFWRSVSLAPSGKKWIFLARKLSLWTQPPPVSDHQCHGPVLFFYELYFNLILFTVRNFHHFSNILQNTVLLEKFKQPTP